MKSNKEILVTYCDVQMKSDGGYYLPAVGTVLTKLPLYDLLFNSHKLEDIPVNAPKGYSGAMFPYIQDTLGIVHDGDNASWSDGIVFIDIDKLPKDEIKKVYESFGEVTRLMPNVLSCWYSFSYYNPDVAYGGLHFVLRTMEDTVKIDNYKKQVVNQGATLCRVIYNATGVDCRPHKRMVYNTDGTLASNKLVGAGLDGATKSIGQRFFLNHSTVQWNDNAIPSNYQIEQQLKEWIEFEETWFLRDNPYKVTKCDVKSIDFSGKTTTINLGFNGRITVLNTLAHLGVNHDDRVKIVMQICGPEDYARGESVLRHNVVQTSHSAERRNVDLQYVERGINILKSVGIDIEAEIETIYQPIEFDFDAIFVEVWESMKDEPYNNIYYNPANVYNFNLTKDEYLTDIKENINDIIINYTMTYLNGDCQLGKTTFALNMQSEFNLFDDSFIMFCSENKIDLCVPYNSVADNKADGNRSDIKRVMTQNLEDFNVDKRNVFIWDTVNPLYEKYYKAGLVKRLILFFDESQKIVTDDYRWTTVFELFKTLPMMYKHFVFMTGTPAGELDFLKQYFSDYCVINIKKEIEFKRECKILKYKQFGNADRTALIEETIANGKLPLIYANSKYDAWRNACIKINLERTLSGLKPYKILEYNRPNAGRLKKVNESNSIKDYDIVLATKYCSVGIDFMKDDKRMRCSIVDFASERECTFHDIWQFTLRNRNQNTVTKIIARDNESYSAKLSNYWYYVEHYDNAAKLIATNFTDDSIEKNDDDLLFVKSVFEDRKFSKYLPYFKNDSDKDKYIKLLGIYSVYVKIFSNMNVIKHMLKRRGVEVIEMSMNHEEEKTDTTLKKEIYKFFVDNFDDISAINSSRGIFDVRSYQIDINSNETENVTDGKIYSRNMHYMDWLIRQFAGKEEWKQILSDYEYMNKDTFAVYNSMSNIARHISKKEIENIKKLTKLIDDETVLDAYIEKLVIEHFNCKVLDEVKEREKALLLKDIVAEYKKILVFCADNIKFIEEIKKAKDDAGRLTAIHKMQIVMSQKEEERIRKAKSKAVKKRNEKPVTVRILDNAMGNAFRKEKGMKRQKEISFNSQKEMAEFFNVSEHLLCRFIKGVKCSLSSFAQVVKDE